MEKDSELGRSLIKQLACCNKNTREKSLRLLLNTWLPSQSLELSDDEAKKLWKGLFYCVWHADKPLFQAELAERLSSLVLSLHLPLSAQYFSVFLLTMRREWTGIDSLRLDKFYLLIRRFISKFFVLLKKNSWNLEIVRQFMGILDQRTFSSQDMFQGHGVNYHVASVFLEELRPLLPVRVEVLEVLFEPFFSVMGKVNDRVLLGKIKSGLFDVFLSNGKRLLEVKKAGEEIDSGDDAVVLGTIALVMGFSSKFYEIGSSTGCCQGNRKVLFGLHELFMKLEKGAAASGFEFSIPDCVDQDEEDVPTLVPIENGMEVDGAQCEEGVANGKLLRKCKKGKKGSSFDGGKKEKKEKEEKKKKKMKKGEAADLSSEKGDAENDNDNTACENGGDSNGEQANDDSTVTLNETVISNLQKQFEKVAEEAGLDDGVASACGSPDATANATASKKRKRTKNSKAKASQDSDLDGGNGEDTAGVKSGEKSTKKVRFSMKNNLVWKPHSPLPPQSLRLPPSATPKGSALKKGVPPGPVIEMLPTTKKAKLKKARKGIKAVVPSVRRVKKLKSRSP